MAQGNSTLRKRRDSCHSTSQETFSSDWIGCCGCCGVVGGWVADGGQYASSEMVDLIQLASLILWKTSREARRGPVSTTLTLPAPRYSGDSRW